MKILKLLLIVLLLAGCSKEKKSTEKLNKELNRDIEMIGIEKTRTSFQLAIKEGRYQDLHNYTTTNVITVGPGSKQWVDMYKQGETRGQFPYDSIVMNPIETIIANDSIAYDFGMSTVYFSEANGNPLALQNTFLAILKKDKDGVWKLHREVASSTVK